MRSIFSTSVMPTVCRGSRRRFTSRPIGRWKFGRRVEYMVGVGSILKVKFTLSIRWFVTFAAGGTINPHMVVGGGGLHQPGKVAVKSNAFKPYSTVKNKGSKASAFTSVHVRAVSVLVCWIGEDPTTESAPKAARSVKVTK